MTKGTTSQTWTVVWERVCEECKASCQKGWRAPNGQYYCKTCWEQWHAMPTPITTKRRAERSLKRGFTIFSGGCPCCSPQMVEVTTKAMQLETWKQEMKPKQDLSAYAFCDAHCHLDIRLQNLKNGSVRWGGKERLCKNWVAGNCWWGSNCQFAHGEHEVQSRQGLSRELVEPYLLQLCGAQEHQPKLKWLVTNCCELDAIEDTKLIIECADRLGLDSVYCTVGCHPHDYRAFSPEADRELRQMIRSLGRRLVAVGECGLDYWKNYDESLDSPERDRMLKVFELQVRVAVDFALPLVVHARDADADTLQVLRQYLPKAHKVYIHAFQGSVNFLLDCLVEFPNSIFGVSSMVWCSDGAKAVAEKCPLERMVLETDAPYLASEPSEIPKLAEKVAEMKSVSTAEVLETTLRVSKQFYCFE